MISLAREGPTWAASPLFGSARTGRAEVDLGHPELCPLDRDPEIAADRIKPSAAHRESVDRRNRRDLEVGQGGEGAPQHAPALRGRAGEDPLALGDVGNPLEAREVGACAKRIARPGDDERANVLIVAYAQNVFFHLRDAVFVERIAFLGTVEGQYRNGVFLLQPEIVGHITLLTGNSPYGRRGACPAHHAMNRRESSAA